MVFQSFGAPFCRGLEPPLDELKHLLSSAKNLGHGNQTIVQQAQRVYDDINGFVAYVPFVGDACEKHIAEVTATVNQLRAFLKSAGAPTQVTEPRRPNFEPPSTMTIPWTAIGIGAGAIFALYVYANVKRAAKLLPKLP